MVRTCYRCVGVVPVCHRFVGIIQMWYRCCTDAWFWYRCDPGMCESCLVSSRIQVGGLNVISDGVRDLCLPSGCISSGLMLLFCAQFVLFPVLLLWLLFLSWTDCSTPVTSLISVSI